MKLLLTSLFIAAVLIVYTRLEIRLNQQPCSGCGARISAYNDGFKCPKCGIDFEDQDEDMR